MARSSLSMRGLEIFEVLARTRSVIKTAEEVGCSVSSVSHHLKKLEEQVGVSLIDHSCRPMELTSVGRGFLLRVEEGLRHIRLAETETVMAELVKTRTLRIAIIDDLDSDIGPELTVTLANNMPNLRLTLASMPSHLALAHLVSRKLDLAIVSTPDTPHEDLQEYPLLHDPFLMAVPAQDHTLAEEHFYGRSTLPLLRFNPEHLIGGQIEAHLKRLKIRLPNRFEIDSIQSITGLVAGGKGWAITTALGFLRGRRFHKSIKLCPLPGPAFSRRVSLFALEDYSPEVATAIADIARRLLLSEAVTPLSATYPWLEPQFRLIDV